MYPNLGDKTDFRLKRINETKKFLKFLKEN